MYPIEKNVPIPAPLVRTSHSELNSTLTKMEVGDSFLINDVRKGIRDVAHQYGREHGRKFATRKVGEGALRIWRVS
jgi:hypothetical protein